MPKSKNTTPAYNALFQEHEPPSVGKNERRGGHFMKVDKGQSCHVFAIASAPTWERSNEVNVAYSNIGTERAMERLNRQFQHEFAEEDKQRLNRDYVIQPFPEPSEEERTEERMSNMREILDVRNRQETVLPVENMYLCGGFREGKMTPEHMWVEDHSNNISYDTFIDRGGIAVVNGVGKDGKPFKPGCEGHAFNGKDIGRIKVDGYTYGQLIAIASGAEKKPPFPSSIANTPQVLMAMETVKLVNEALEKIPDPILTEDEKRVVKAVQEEQLTKDSDTAIKKVVTDLKQPEKGFYESAMAKYAEVGRLQREAARAIVGTGFHPFVKLNQELNDAIKPEQITQSKTLKEAHGHYETLINKINELEEKKNTLPAEYQDKFQEKIDTLRNSVQTQFDAKVKVRETVEQIRRAATSYLEWSNQNATGWRLTNWSYGSYGREQAQKLLDMIKNEDTPMANILKVANETVNTSGTNKNSFSRYLHDELKGTHLVGKDTLTEKFKNYKEEMKTQLRVETEKEENNTRARI
ncbi:hypothetical protein [Legionella sainthelensi]|uniref:Uncharacterized protein n=1 Tax=Legionella sainthelensi TaxID=28087 RepID=A0A2H5FIV8_9GAMM|nr:hypothetical protein [Legionella sainthelensi]AUH71490.1 hypothetical protein CAB17_04970 [Legionella sainthelensi]